MICIYTIYYARVCVCVCVCIICVCIYIYTHTHIIVYTKLPQHTSPVHAPRTKTRLPPIYNILLYACMHTYIHTSLHIYIHYYIENTP